MGACVYKENTFNNLVKRVQEVLIRPIGHYTFVITVLPSKKHTGKKLLKIDTSVDYAVRRQSSWVCV